MNGVMRNFGDLLVYTWRKIDNYLSKVQSIADFEVRLKIV